jgi:hypothetical protein
MVNRCTLGHWVPFPSLLRPEGLRWRYSISPPHGINARQVTLRPTVSRPVCLGVRRPSGTCDQFVFLLEVSFIKLRVCNFVAPTLTRGRVCNLLLFLVLASEVILLCNHKRTKFGKPHSYRELICATKNCQ